jgi:polyisoprenoid-binding protein YceI
MKKYFAFILLLSFKAFSFAQAKHTVTNSSVKFEIKNMGINTGGSFSGLKADIKFDPEHLDVSTIEASIDTKTINTDNETRDHHLKSDSYFDADKYPEITMKSMSFKRKNGDSFAGMFKLTIKDKTNPVEVPFTYSENGNTTSFKGTLKIKRTDYGLGGKSLVMANDVTVTIAVDTSK